MLEHGDAKLPHHRVPIVVAEGIEAVASNAVGDQRLVIVAEQRVLSGESTPVKYGVARPRGGVQ